MSKTKRSAYRTEKQPKRQPKRRDERRLDGCQADADTMSARKKAKTVPALPILQRFVTILVANPA